MIKHSRRLLLLGWLAVGLAAAAPACTGPTAPRLPELEEEETDSVPEDG